MTKTPRNAPPPTTASRTAAARVFGVSGSRAALQSRPPDPGVGAAWAMTQMTSSADKVALVRTAMIAARQLISMPAGASPTCDDRRVGAMVSLAISRWARPAHLLAWLQSVTPNSCWRCLIVGPGGHGADGTGLAILGQPSRCRRKPCWPRWRSRHQLQTSPASLAADRRHHRGDRRRSRGFAATPCSISAADRAVSLGQGKRPSRLPGESV